MHYLWEVGAALTGLLTVIALLTPRASASQFRFGVSVAEPYRSDPRLRNAEHTYYTGVLLGALAALPLLAVSESSNLDWLGVVSPITVVVAVGASYLVARQEVLRLRRSAEWTDTGPRMAVAEMVPTRTDATWPAWALLPAGVWVAFLVWGILLYPSLPSTLPTHFGANGVPDSYSAKGPFSVFAGTIVGAAVLGIFVVLAAAITRARAPLDPRRPRGDAERQFQFRYQTVRALLAMGATVQLTIGIASLQTWAAVPPTGIWQLLLFVPLFVGIVALVGVMFRLGQLGSRLPLVEEVGGEPDHEAALRRARDDDQKWTAGVMYWNREDSALLVPRRFGMGWTLNWGNPWSWVLLGALVGVPFLILIAARFG